MKNNIDLKSAEMQTFILPKINTKEYEAINTFIGQSKKIDGQIISTLIQSNHLFEDLNHNVVFVCNDNQNNPIGAYIYGFKNSVSKGLYINSNKDYGFSIMNASKNLYVFESPIEMLCFCTLLKLSGDDWAKNNYLSLNGISNRSLDKYLENSPNIQKITLCLNNDNYGIKIAKKYSEKYIQKGYVCAILFPQRKDFSEDLLLIKSSGFNKHCHINEHEEYEDDLER